MTLQHQHFTNSKQYFCEPTPFVLNSFFENFFSKNQCLIIRCGVFLYTVRGTQQKRLIPCKYVNGSTVNSAQTNICCRKEALAIYTHTHTGCCNCVIYFSVHNRKLNCIVGVMMTILGWWFREIWNKAIIYQGNRAYSHIRCFKH